MLKAQEEEEEDYRPRWRVENRGWTNEEAEAYKDDVVRRSKLSEMAEANEAGRGLFGSKEE